MPHEEAIGLEVDVFDCKSANLAHAETRHGRGALDSALHGVLSVLGRLGPSAVAGALRDDELALVLVGAGANEAIYAAERLHRLVHTLSDAGALGGVPVTVSVGIAPTSAERYDESSTAARAALNDARRKGIRRTSSAPEPRVSHVRIVRSPTPLVRRVG
jgi:GGDEF domain-containing protein